MTTADPASTAATRDVFLCHASKDAEAASALVAALERDGVSCWIAPRDVVAGALYADSIVRAINSTKVLVLLLSEAAVESKHVGKEIERAASKGHPIVTIRLDAVSLPPAFEYFLSESHWLDASVGNVDSVVEAVAQGVRSLGGTPASPASAQPVPGKSANPSGRWLKAGVLGALAAALVAAWWLMAAGSRGAAGHLASASPKDKSIAVLPFDDLSEKKDQGYFADGLSEEVGNVLSRIPELRVIGRESAFKFKGSEADPRTVGAQLGVSHVLRGGVRKVGDRVRVSARLVRTADGTQEWAGTFDRNLDDLLQVQNELALSLGRALQLSIPGEPGSERVARVNAQAYDLYLRGLQSVYLYSPQGVEAGAALFQRAVDLDPQFLRAREMLAHAHVVQATSSNMAPEQAFAKVREDVAQLLAADPHSAIAQSYLCRLDTVNSFNWTQARRECASAIERGPHNWIVLYNAAILAQALGEFPRAEKCFREIIAADPLNSDAHVSLADVLVRQGRFSEAEREAREGLAITPTFEDGPAILATTLMAQGRLDEASKAIALESGEDYRTAGIAEVSHALGRKQEAAEALDKLIRYFGETSPFQVAEVYAFQGDAERSVDWLGRAYRLKDSGLAYLRGDWYFRGIEQDPRYKEFLRKLGPD